MSEPVPDRRTARYEAMRIMAEAEVWQEASKELVRVLGESFVWDAVALWIVHEPSRTIRCDAFWAGPGGGVGDFEAVSSRTFFSLGECLPGRVWSTGADQWVRDISRDTGFLRGREAAGL